MCCCKTAAQDNVTKVVHLSNLEINVLVVNMKSQPNTTSVNGN